MLKESSATATERLVEAGLGDRIVHPHEPKYNELVTPHWSLAAELTPHAVVLPRSAEEVAKTVVTLSKVDGCIFAVRSGGHTCWPGASNVNDGVVIDLSQMKEVTYDAEKDIVSAQAGCRWRHVYGEAEKHGKTVNGGRMADVGIGGFLCGGGISWLLPRFGFGCDTVANYEVVLADGRIIQANKDDNEDLFRALKGGAANFGIVTRFDLVAIDGANVWGGMHICPKSTSQEHIELFVDYIDTIEQKDDTSYGLVWAWSSMLNDVAVSTMMCNTKGVANPPALEKVIALPSIMSTVQARGVTALAEHMVSPAETFHNTWMPATFKNDTRILSKAVETHERFVEKLKTKIPADGFSTICFAQAMPQLYAKRSQERGGNVLGVELLGEDCIAFLAAAHIRDKEHLEFGLAALREWYDELVAYAKSIGVWKDWLYLNYADKSQNPLRTFGEENVKKIRAAAEKYDPEGVFQTKCPGGFKISRV